MRSVVCYLLSFIFCNIYACQFLHAQETPVQDIDLINFLIGKTNFEQNSNFIKISQDYTSLKGENAYLQKQTYDAFIEMYNAALKDGIKLQIISASRNYWVQRYIWEQKWKSVNISSIEERAKYVLRYNAMPGISRHHWGSEIDLNSTKLAYWDSKEGRIVYNWLKNNAGKYGFFQPYTSGRKGGFKEERWHWSYYPLSAEYLKLYKEKVTSNDIAGFIGDKVLDKLNIINNYVLNIDCYLH